MKKARYGSPDGPLMEAKAFFDKATADYKKLGILPYCEACQEVVHLYGVNTPNPNTTARFDHANRAINADPLDDCVLANRNQRYQGSEPDAWDEEQAISLQQAFFEEANLAKAYAFCLALCRKGNLPVSKFQSMLDRADRKRIWAYADIPLWSIPYIILTLENFTATTDKGKPYEFHFSFQKPQESTISALWKYSNACRIVKLFSNTGEPVSSSDNPYPISETAMLAKAGDPSWVIRNGILQKIKANHQR